MLHTSTFNVTHEHIQRYTRAHTLHLIQSLLDPDLRLDLKKQSGKFNSGLYFIKLYKFFTYFPSILGLYFHLEFSSTIKKHWQIFEP